MVGGVNPAKAGTTHLGLPVFASCAEARARSGCNATVIYVPPPAAAAAILEAVEAGVVLVAAHTGGKPPGDMGGGAEKLPPQGPGARALGPGTHAGAIISGGKGTAKEKVEALEAAGVTGCQSPATIGETMEACLRKGGLLSATPA